MRRYPAAFALAASLLAGAPLAQAAPVVTPFATIGRAPRPDPYSTLAPEVVKTSGAKVE